MRVRINRCRHRFGFTAAARIVCQASVIQHLCRFTAELVQQAVRNKQRIRQIHLNGARVIDRLTQLCHAVFQVVKRFFGIVCHLKLTVKHMRYADTIFAGQGEDQLLFPAAKFDIHRDTALTGGFQQRLLPVVVKVAVQRGVRARLKEIGRHFIWPHAVTIFAGFFHCIGTETHHFAFDHHVQAIAVCQRLRHFHVQIIFRHFQHFTDGQTDKLRRIKRTNIAFTGIHKVVRAAAMEGFVC